MSIRLFSLLTVLIVPLMGGCQSLDLISFSDDEPQIPAATDVNPVREIICMWEAAEGLGLDGKPARGFAGQILFFTAAHPQPVRADGDVRILLYDKQGLAEDDPHPFKQYEFSSEVWDAFLRDTNLGAAHHVFIPDPRPGNYYEECAIRVVFTPKSGLPVYSKTAMVVLPGRKRPEEARTAESAVETAMRSAAQHVETSPPRDLLSLKVSADPMQPRRGAARINELRRTADQMMQGLQPDADENPAGQTAPESASQPEPTRPRYRLTGAADESTQRGLRPQPM